ncbi:MAG: class II aldolase/adducin family protein [Methanobacteriaceae archaeon]|nr:class II aldolase/adducin family protein [Methanobacteriaceae archaeon]
MDNPPLTREICKTAHYIYNKGLTPGKSGNISAFSNEVIAITPSGVSLGYVKEEEICLVDLDGNLLSGSENPSSELHLHLEIYQNRDDVHAIVHTHSSYATGFALAGKMIERLEGFGVRKTPFLKMVDYAEPGSSELAKLVAHGLEDEDVVILKNHGLVAIGKNLFEATLLAEFVEETAKTQFVSCVLGSMDF